MKYEIGQQVFVIQQSLGDGPVIRCGTVERVVINSLKMAVYDVHYAPRYDVPTPEQGPLPERALYGTLEEARACARERLARWLCDIEAATEETVGYKPPPTIKTASYTVDVAGSVDAITNCLK